MEGKGKKMTITTQQHELHHAAQWEAAVLNLVIWR